MERKHQYGPFKLMHCNENNACKEIRRHVYRVEDITWNNTLLITSGQEAHILYFSVFMLKH